MAVLKRRPRIALLAPRDHARSLEIDRAGVRLRLERAAGLESARARLAWLAALVRDLSGPPASGAYR